MWDEREAVEDVVEAVTGEELCLVQGGSDQAPPAAARLQLGPLAAPAPMKHRS